jgi:hypothetical protein
LFEKLEFLDEIDELVVVIDDEVLEGLEVLELQQGEVYIIHITI